MSVKSVATKHVRAVMREVARGLDRLSNHSITPDHVSWLSLIGHILVVFLILNEQLVLGAVLLAFFGILDTLDGELARLTNSASARGMLLDATFDRLKEGFVLASIAALGALREEPLIAFLACLALGFSLTVSYVKAKGEAVLGAEGKLKHAELNRTFSDGIFSFEVRIVVIILALLTNQLLIGTAILAIGAGLTVAQRLSRVSRSLSS